MPPSSATALVLRQIPFSETSLVVALLTREFGKLQGLAKGARRLKSPFQGALELLSVCRIVFLPRASEGLHLLTEALLLERFRPEHSGLRGLFAAYYVAELLDAFTAELGPLPELFDVAVATLRSLQQPMPPELTLLKFELGLLRCLGHLGQFDRCSNCGREIPVGEPARVTEAGGGLVCGRCLPRVGRGPIIGQKVRSWLHKLSTERLSAMGEESPAEEAVISTDSAADQTGSRLPTPTLVPSAPVGTDADALVPLDWDPATYRAVRGLVSHWICHLLARKPKLFPYLEKLGFFSGPAAKRPETPTVR
jgi:DNA repair protein RecO (recombination protein O)